MNSLKRSWPVGVTLVLAGCGAMFQAPAAVTASTAPATTSATLLPFATVAFDDNGLGPTLKAGPSEMVVLRSKADLDAFVARHPAAVAPVSAPVVGIPSISPAYPPNFTPVAPVFKPSPLPDALESLDFNTYEAIAFFDGSPKVASLARITAVKESGGSLVVSTQQWDPPVNPAAIPDVNGRLHVVALARSTEPVTFAPLTVETTTMSTYGGYSVGGNPQMRPQWPAVANPAITRDVVASAVMRLDNDDNDDGPQGDAEFAKRTLTLESVASLGDGAIAASLPFTSDSLVWVATYESDLPGDPSPVPSPLPSQGTPWSRVPPPQLNIEIFSPEDGHMCGGWGVPLASASPKPSTI